jgi:hypothetical protein
MSKSIPESPENTGPSKTNRSRITNGSKLLHGIDGRSAQARRFRDLVAQFSADLGDELSAAELSLIKIAASLVVQGEQHAARIVRGETVDADESVRLANVANRLLQTLMAKRAKRKPGPSLQQYLAERGAR